MRHSRSELAALVGAALLVASVPRPAEAQRRPPPPRPVPRIDDAQRLPALLLDGPAPMPGGTGAATSAAAMQARGWSVDSLGNATLMVGSGSPRRVIACGVDEPGFVVSEITDDGFLRLQAPADPRRHPLWDQFHEGQRVSVETSPGTGVWGVTAVRSTHLWRRRAAGDAITTVEDLWVDVGARSRREAESRGIGLLQPVRRAPATWVYGGTDTLLAGPGIARRAGCAAVAAAAARGAPARGQSVFVLSAQSAFQYAGLSAVLARLGRVDSVVVVDASLVRADSAPSATGPQVGSLPSSIRVPSSAAGAARLAVALPSRFTGTLVESVSMRDVAALAERVAELAGTSGGRGGATFTGLLPTGPGDEPRDSLSDVGALMSRLTSVYALSEHEQRMRDAVLRELPAWARARTTTDSAGNLVLALGPDRDTVVFVAHMDEIGFEITSIARDGVVGLRQRGGFFLSLFEGQPALLHYESDADAARWLAARGCHLGARGGGAPGLSGVFVPRSSATSKQPAQLTAWFGADSAGLAACGVRPGMAITGEKVPLRLTGTRFTARSIDDRAGCASLILALRDLDPARLTHKVIFTWSVREETALGGAAAMAATFGPSVKRVYAVDTFVSSDSPLESPRFAYAPIGAGAVVRALDNSSATPPDETARVVRIAREAGIPLQVGTTNGGNDGSEFTRYGAVDVPLSWPLRYSHSPAEVIDLADVRSLARLVAELARR